ncbi:hypothetical protein MNBD_GAMMA06-1710 [hydrothermal vent metagenome]|uniref:DUF5666 domain-containing protein n=1 Tax=hydrothermal vent metagenome TaxID=652676 RepID=A0A3B0WL39_9ZZZZ
MNSLLTKIILIGSFALSITACELGSSPSGGNNANVNTEPGYISSGTITDRGSIFVNVNGVEFDTSSTTFDVDGSSGTQDDLDIGMIVQVTGDFNDDGTTGTATDIRYNDALQGPVAALNSANDTKHAFTVLGINIIIDNANTRFDVSSGANLLPATPPFAFDTIDVNNNVEISGFLDSDGNLNATRVELKDFAFTADDSIVEIKGVVTGLANNIFNLDGISLSIDATAASIEGMANGIVDDMFVEVKGTLNDAGDTLTASKVELENNFIDVSGKIEIEGIITDYVNDDSNFLINGLSVNASNATREPASLNLENDIRVEVETTIGINTLLVTKIKLR